jgi:NADH-quinone oxidoreductase subunit D
MGRRIPAVSGDIDDLLTENRIFKQRNVDIGVVTRRTFRTGRFPA